MQFFSVEMDRTNKPDTSTDTAASKTSEMNDILTYEDLDLEILPLVYEVIRWYVIVSIHLIKFIIVKKKKQQRKML